MNRRRQLIPRTKAQLSHMFTEYVCRIDLSIIFQEEGQVTDLWIPIELEHLLLRRLETKKLIHRLVVSKGPFCDELCEIR